MLDDRESGGGALVEALVRISLGGIAVGSEGHFHVTLARRGLMYMVSPVAALQAARRVMVDRGVLVAAVMGEPAQCSYFSFPRRVLGSIEELEVPLVEVPRREELVTMPCACESPSRRIRARLTEWRARSSRASG